MFVQVKSFKEKDEVDAWLFSNPMRCLEALHFSERNDIVISYDLQTNSTSLQQRGKYEDPTALFQLPLQLAAEREIARYLIGGVKIFKITRYICHNWIVFVFQSLELVFLREFAHPSMNPFSTVASNFRILSPKYTLLIHDPRKLCHSFMIKFTVTVWFFCSLRQWIWWGFTTLLTGFPGSSRRQLSRSYRPSL